MKYALYIYYLGPEAQANVVTSGVAVSETLNSFPATVSFTLIDDDTSIEAVERYFLTLVPSDPSIPINQLMAEIVIIDEDRRFHTCTLFCH